MIGFARALQEAGHSVVLATIDVYQYEIERAGIEFFCLPPDWEQQELSYWMGRLQKIRGPIFQLNELYKAAEPYIVEMTERMEVLLEDSDVLVSSYFFPLNKFIADRKGIPFATFAFAHNTIPNKHYPPEDLPRFKWLPLRFQMVWNDFLWRVGNRLVDFIINRTIAKRLDACGLPRVKNFFSKPADLVLVALSPALMKPSYKIDKRFQFVGYCRWQSTCTSEDKERVEAFTRSEKVPVLTFGSMVYEDPERTIREFLEHWPQKKKIIIQKGWAQFPEIPGFGNALFIDHACHDWLFKHASIVIHHGGAGTTASVLFSGKPQVVVPHIGDQNFFGKEVERLGVGVRCPRKKWTKHLYSSVQFVLERWSYGRRAEEVFELLKREDGARGATEVLEAFVEKQAIRRPKELMLSKPVS